MHKLFILNANVHDAMFGELERLDNIIFKSIQTGLSREMYIQS